MAVVLKSNRPISAGAYPQGMDSYIDRVRSDSGQILNLPLLLETFQAIEDEGMTCAASGGAFGVKVEGGYVTRLYDLFTPDLDLTPSTNAVTSVLDGDSLDMPLGAGTSVSRPHYRPISGTFTGVAGSVGIISCFSLDNPLAIVNTTIATMQEGSSSRALMIANPEDAYSRVSFGSYDPSLANTSYLRRKDKFQQFDVVGGLRDLTGAFLYFNGVCERSSFFGDNGFYAGRPMYPQIGSPSSDPAMTVKFCIWFTGPVTARQVARITARLKAAL
jgi:hypothetical protein